MTTIEHQPLNHQNRQLYQTGMTPATNWKYQDNPTYASVGKSPYEPLHWYGPGYSSGENKSQGISAGAGTIPIEGGMREDGLLVSPQGTSHNLNSHTDIVNKGYIMSTKAHNNTEAVWNGTMKNKYSTSDWSNHIYPPQMFDPSLSGTSGRSWNHSYNGISGYNPVHDDDSSVALEAGPADLTPDTNQGNMATISQYKNQGNNNYDVTKKAHPTDVIGSAINHLSNVAKGNMSKPKHKNHHEKQKNAPDSNHKIEKEIEMIENKDYRCVNSTFPYHKTTNDFPGQYCSKEDQNFGKSIESKDFCYINDTIPPSLVNYYGKIGIKACGKKKKDKHEQESVDNNRISNRFKARLNLTDDRRKYYDSKVSEDKRHYQSDVTLDRNQLMVDNNRPPININVSCNQGGRGGYRDEYGYYSGYGTPNLYDECVYNNRGCYGDTLNNWYGDMSANNNVYRRRQRWKDRDYYREGSYRTRPNFSSSRDTSMSNSEIARTVIGAPYATYTPYSQVNQASSTNYVDKARDAFNETRV